MMSDNSRWLRPDISGFSAQKQNTHKSLMLHALISTAPSDLYGKRCDFVERMFAWKRVNPTNLLRDVLMRCFNNSNETVVHECGSAGSFAPG